MTTERFDKILETVDWQEEIATGIMQGEENYAGADGARYVLKLCSICRELLAEVKPS